MYVSLFKSWKDSFPKWLCKFTFQIIMFECSIFLTSLPTLSVVGFLNFSDFNIYLELSHCLICISLNWWYWSSFMFVCYTYISFVHMSFHSNFWLLIVHIYQYTVLSKTIKISEKIKTNFKTLDIKQQKITISGKWETITNT